MSTDASACLHPTPPPPSGLVPVPALVAILAASGIATLDIAIANTALPTIARDLGVDSASSVWVINVYHLAVTAALLPLGALGEIVGQRRVFLIGLVAFTLASLACGLAQSLPALVAARAFQGLGAAAIAGVTPALIRFLYQPQRLGRGLGVYALIVGVAFTIGPTAASAILSVAAWPWLFLVNVPIGLIAGLMALRSLPATARSKRDFDALSALLCAAFFALLLLGLGEGAHHASWPWIVGPLAASAVCNFALVRREAGRPAPILAVDLFRIRMFALSSATSVCAFTVQSIAFVALPFLMHSVLGLNQVQIGFLITPWPAVVAIMALVAAPLADRYPTGILGGAGLLLLSGGMAGLALLPNAPAHLDIIWRLVLCGIGFGLFQSPNMRAIMSSAPPDRSGSASGILAASRLFGQSLGAVLVAMCLTQAPLQGAEFALWCGCVVALAGSAISFSRLLPAPKSGPTS